MGRKTLRELGTIVTPETSLRWHRELVARKWTFIERRRPGRPRTREELAALVVRMANENPAGDTRASKGQWQTSVICWAEGRFAGSSKITGSNRPLYAVMGCPGRSSFKAHWKALVAADFFSVEVWSWRGLTTHYVLFVIDLATRRIRIAGITAHPNADWMMQVGRNLLDVVDGPLAGKKYLILDRDTKYCAAFRQMLGREYPAATALAQSERVRGTLDPRRA